jgi:hypothetical protein
MFRDNPRSEEQIVSTICIGHDELAPRLLRKRGNEAVEGDRNSEVVSNGSGTT